MNVVNGFFIVLMLLFLAYTAYRLVRRKGLLMLIALCAQLFAISIAVFSFFNNVQALDIIQACFLLLGIVIPLFYLAHDYWKMLSKVKEQGVYEGFIEPAPKDGEGEKPLFLPMDAFNPQSRDRQPGDILKGVELNGEELLKNLRKCLNHAYACTIGKDYAGAFEFYNFIIKLIPGNPGLYYNHGNTCCCLGKWNEAVASYKKALELCGGKKDGGADSAVPDANMAGGEFMIHYNLGNAQFMLKRYDKAAKCYEKALKLNPAFVSARENMAFCLVAAGEREKALGYFKAASVEDASNLRLHRILAGLLTEMGRYAEAEAELNECVRLEPESLESLEELGRLYIRQSKLNEGIGVFDRMIRQWPGTFQGYNLKAGACYRLGLKKEAVECYKKAVQLKNDSHRSYYNMAVALDELGDRAAAAEAFKKAIRLKPDFVDAYNNLGVVLSTMGKLDAALEVYEEGIGKNPGEYSLFLNMGIALSETGRYREAAAAYRNAIDLKPDEYEVYYYLGASLTEMRHYNDAIEAYKAALKVKPSDSELYYNIATVYALLARYDIARDNLRRAIELNGELRNDARTDRAFDGMRGKSDFKELVS